MQNHRTSTNLCAALILSALVAGCEDAEVAATGTPVYPGDYYAYSYYYPADLAYSVPYWVDDWYDSPYLYSSPKALVEAAGHTTGSLLRALATGEELCPSQLSVDPAVSEVECDDDGEIRRGARITFEGCELDNGGRLDGTLMLESDRTFSSDECAPDTVVTVSFSGTFDELIFSEPDGARLVVPALTSAGSYTRRLDGRPAAVSVSQSGSFERYASDGTLLTQVDLSADQGVVVGAPPDTWLFRLFGPAELQDPRSGRTLTLSAVDLIHEPGCCHPVAGSLRLTSVDGGPEVLTYGPTCAVASLNDEVVTLPECP